MTLPASLQAWLPRRGGWARRGLLIGGLFLAAAVIAFALRSWSKSRQVAAELARIRAAGEPVTYDDLAARYETLPADEEATRFWLDAFAARKPYNARLGTDLPMVGMGTDMPAPGKKWPQLEAVEEYLDYESAYLRMLHQAADHRGIARLPTRFGAAVNPDDYTDALRMAVPLLTLQACVRAHRGNADQAAQSLHAAFAGGRLLERLPGSIPFLSMVALDGIVVGEIESLLSVIDISDGQLARMQATLRQARYKQALHAR